MSPFLSHRQLLAMDAFEGLVENAIMGPEDLYELDGETMFRRCGGCIETFDAELEMGGQP